MSEFNFDSWDGKIESLPTGAQTAYKNALDAQPPPSDDPLKDYFKTGTEDNDVAKQVDARFDELSQQRAHDDQMSKIRMDLGVDYQKYASAAKPYIDKGYSPEDAFSLAQITDKVAAAELRGRNGLASEKGQRNAELSHRGNGTGSSISPGDNGNPYASREAYDAQKSIVNRMPLNQAQKWVYDNPQFVQAAKDHGDVKASSRF